MEIDGFRPRRERMDANEELLLVEDQEILDIQGMLEMGLCSDVKTFALILCFGLRSNMFD